jgi:hypothetical protein
MLANLEDYCQLVRRNLWMLSPSRAQWIFSLIFVFLFFGIEEDATRPDKHTHQGQKGTKLLNHSTAEALHPKANEGYQHVF